MRYALITNQDLFRMTGQGSTSNGEIPPLELCGLGILEANHPIDQVNRDPFQAWSAWGLQVSVWRKVYQHGRGRGAFWRAGPGIGWGSDIVHGFLDILCGKVQCCKCIITFLKQNILRDMVIFWFQKKLKSKRLFWNRTRTVVVFDNEGLQGFEGEENHLKDLRGGDSF